MWRISILANRCSPQGFTIPPPPKGGGFLEKFDERYGYYGGMCTNEEFNEALVSVVKRRNRIVGSFSSDGYRSIVRVTPAEIRARQTLRDLVTEKEWRRYLTNGFVMALGRSGKVYQIKSDRSHTIVWENNRKVKELCIVADEKCPPTDHVLTIKLMVELDEKAVWAGANKHNIRNRIETPEEAAREFEESALVERNQRRA